MFKWIITFLFCLLSVTAYALPFSFQPPSVPKPSSGNGPSLTPQEYKEQVGTLYQQNIGTMNQQTQQLLSKVPPPPTPIINESTKAPATGLTIPAPSRPPEQTSVTATAPPSPIKPLPLAPQPINPDAYSSINKPSGTATPGTKPTQPQQQIYTGFQGSTTTGTSNSNAQQPKPGWNIRY